MKKKYIIGTLLLASLTICSASSEEVYGKLLPIIYGILTVFSIAIAITDTSKSKNLE
jgi:hypothetical protein